MTDMAVIVPTRGRPENMKRLMRAWKDTQAEARLIFGTDDDDDATRGEAFDEIIDLADELGLGSKLEILRDPRTCMNGTLNRIAVTQAPRHKYLAFMGDDHLPRTLKWDQHIARELRWEPSMVYGNDKMHGPNLPTAIFMTSSIVRTLGYMAPSQFTHLYIDNVWKTWGESLRTRGPHHFRYMPDVVIEHCHPQAGGKSEWDEGYLPR